MGLLSLQRCITLLVSLIILAVIGGNATAESNVHPVQKSSPSKPRQLSANFYSKSCPSLAKIVEGIVVKAVDNEKRMAASLLRLHFHDCFVNGCDASILLDDTTSAKGEKTSPPNNNSLRGYDVIDAIKSAVEAKCPGTVSCADIVALAAEVSVARVGGPSWNVLLGRRDSTTANFTAPLRFLPGPNQNLSAIVAKFAAVGLSAEDAVILSGAHSIGDARCSSFTSRLYNFSSTGKPDITLDPTYLNYLQGRCPRNQTASSSATLNALDVATPVAFDNSYYKNLLNYKGLLHSDQELYSAGDASSARLVKLFSSNQKAFFSAFAKSMVKMGNIAPLTGSYQGQIRLNCRLVN